MSWLVKASAAMEAVGLPLTAQLVIVVMTALLVICVCDAVRCSRH